MLSKKILCAFPTGLLNQIDFVAQAEHRTRSDLMREAMRCYLAGFQQRNPAAAVPAALLQRLTADE